MSFLKSLEESHSESNIKRDIFREIKGYFIVLIIIINICFIL